MSDIILFKKDWDKYPSAFPDYSTTNKSYIELAQKYKLMGIKNYLFHLAIVNPNLVGIDPFYEGLQEHEIAAIATECLINPWFFFREILKVPPESGKRAGPLRANRANISLYWSFFNHILYSLTQPRQSGKSISANGGYLWCACVGCRDTAITLLTKNEDLRRKNVEDLKEMQAELPWYIAQKSRSDSNNSEYFTVNSRNNIINLLVPQAMKMRAENQGRGNTTSVFGGDEGPFQVNVHRSMPIALMGRTEAVDIAESVGAPHGVILTTTAGKQDTPEGEYYYDSFVVKAAQWTEAFLDAKDRDELYDMVKKAGRGYLRINGTFNHLQLGKSDEWLFQKIKESTADADTINRDYLGVWTSGNAGHPLSQAVLTRINASRREPVWVEVTPERYMYNWQYSKATIEDVLTNELVVISIDPSEALGPNNDDIGITFIHSTTARILGGASINETNILTYAQSLATMLVKYPKLFLMIERKSTGGSILDAVAIELCKHGINPFKRIFNRVVHEADEFPERFKELTNTVTKNYLPLYNKYKKYFGYPTAGSGDYSRDMLYGNTLKHAANICADTMGDSKLIDQVMGLLIKNNRIDHQDGKHDDMVIAWLMTIWFFVNGKHVDYYNITPTMLLSEATIKSDLTEAEMMAIAEQNVIKATMTELLERISCEDDDYVVDVLENELRRLDSKLIHYEGTEVMSLAALVQDAKEQRKRNRTSKRIYLRA